MREDVARLEATRTELATDVESMARHLESERNRLRDALTRDPQVGRRERAAGQLAHGRASEGRRVAEAGRAQRPSPPTPAERPEASTDGEQPTLNLAIGRRCDPERSRPLYRLIWRGWYCPLGPPSAMVTRSLDAIVVREPTSFNGREGGQDEPSEQGHRCKEGACIAPAGEPRRPCRRRRVRLQRLLAAAKKVAPTKRSSADKESCADKECSGCEEARSDRQRVAGQ